MFAGKDWILAGRNGWPPSENDPATPMFSAYCKTSLTHYMSVVKLKPNGKATFPCYKYHGDYGPGFIIAYSKRLGSNIKHITSFQDICWQKNKSRRFQSWQSRVSHSFCTINTIFFTRIPISVATDIEGRSDDIETVLSVQTTQPPSPRDTCVIILKNILCIEK